jgi:hypothetical protein
MPHLETAFVALRQIPRPPKNLTSFFDMAAGGINENEGEIAKLLVSSIRKNINNTSDSQLFDLTKAMQTMIGGSEPADDYLRNENPSDKEIRKELMQIVQLLKIGGDHSNYGEDFTKSSCEKVRNVCSRLVNCSDNGKEILRNFTLRLIVDLVERNFVIFNDDEKQQWHSQVGKEPSDLYAEFHARDEEQRQDLARRAAEAKEKKINRSSLEDLNSNAEEFSSKETETNVISFSANNKRQRREGFSDQNPETAIFFPTNNVGIIYPSQDKPSSSPRDSQGFGVNNSQDQKRSNQR